MKIDCNSYKKALLTAQAQLLAKCKIVGAVQAATELSCYTHVPLAAVIMFLMLPENIGPTKELTDKLEFLIKFYKYDEIVPLKFDNKS